MKKIRKNTGQKSETLEDEQPSGNTDTHEDWNKIVKTCIDAVSEIVGTKSKKTKFSNPETDTFCMENHDLRLQIECCKDEDKKKTKKQQQNEIEKKIQILLKQQEEQILDEKFKETEMKNDSNRHHHARSSEQNTQNPIISDRQGWQYSWWHNKQDQHNY